MRAVLLVLCVCTPIIALPVSSRLYGNTSHVPSADLENRLDGVHLTIVTTEDPPFITVRDPAPGSHILPAEQWSGWIPEVIRECSKLSGFTFSLQLSSSKATTAYGASDSEVIFGRVRSPHNGVEYAKEDKGGYGKSTPDVHWAGAYITHKRLDSLHMTAPYAAAPLSLMVNRPTIKWTERVWAVFRPFTPTLWAVVISAWLLVSSLIFMFELSFAAQDRVVSALEAMQTKAQKSTQGIAATARRASVISAASVASMASKFNFRLGNSMKQTEATGNKVIPAIGQRTTTSASALQPGQAQPRESMSMSNVDVDGARKNINVARKRIRKVRDRQDAKAKMTHEQKQDLAIMYQATANGEWTTFAEAYVNCLYNGFITFTGFGTFSPSSHEGQMVSLLWNVIVIFIKTCFVASSAVYLVQSMNVAHPDNFDVFVDPDLSVCVLEGSAYAAFLRSHRSYKYFTQVGVKDLDGMVQALLAGNCTGIVEREIHLQYIEQQAQLGQMANGLTITDRLTDGPSKLAVMLHPHGGGTIETHLNRKLSYWLTKMAIEGTVDGLFKENVLKAPCSLPKSCLHANKKALDRPSDAIVEKIQLERQQSSLKRASGTSGHPTKFAIIDVFGVLLVLAISTTIICGVRAVQVRRKYLITKDGNDTAEAMIIKIQSKWRQHHSRKIIETLRKSTTSTTSTIAPQRLPLLVVTQRGD